MKPTLNDILPVIAEQLKAGHSLHIVQPQEEGKSAAPCAVLKLTEPLDTTPPVIRVHLPDIHEYQMYHDAIEDYLEAGDKLSSSHALEIPDYQTSEAVYNTLQASFYTAGNVLCAVINHYTARFAAQQVMQVMEMYTKSLAAQGEQAASNDTTVPAAEGETHAT